MEISRDEESNQAHEMMVAAVDFISDPVNQVWTSLNVANQEWCNMLHGVTLNYEGHPLVPSLISLSCSLALYWHPTPTFLQRFLYFYSFTEHLWVRDSSRDGHVKINRKCQSFPRRCSRIENHRGAWKRALRYTGVRQIQHLVQLELEELTVRPWTSYLASLNFYSSVKWR